ncbi:MAG: PAS domain-containing protein [Dehalococcoidia bacterium]|jgi:PAS domain S-box-containing protein
MSTQFKTENQHEQGLTALRRYISEYEEMEIERKQQEEKLPVSKTRNRSAGKQRKDAIYISTQDGKFVNINQQMLDLLGYDMNEMMSMDIRNICVNPVDLDRLQKEIDQKGYVISNRLKLYKKDGTEVSCLITSTIRWYNEDNIPGNQPMFKSWVRCVN